MEKPAPEFLIHIYDEIAEAQVRIPRKEYEKYLVKWGIEDQKAAKISSMADYKDNGYITRDELCSALNCWPDRPEELKDVKVLNTDMPLKKRESIILLVCDCANKWNHKYDLVIEIKKRIEGVYGNVWNAFVVDGRFWSIYTHKPGSNLVFVSKGIVYGVYQSPNVE
uniref:Dynein light chain type 1 n=1 Tax=Schistocephalus solidus TaxID=70667 RepID=A0A0X3PQL2_SCHSO